MLLPPLPCPESQAEDGAPPHLPCCFPQCSAPSSPRPHTPDLPLATSPHPTGQTYLLPLHWGQCGRDAGGPAGVHAVLGQCEGLLHAEAGEGRVQVIAMQAHGGGHSPLNGAAASLPGVFPAVSIGGLVPKKEEPALRWGCLASCECQAHHMDDFMGFSTMLWINSRSSSPPFF